MPTFADMAKMDFKSLIIYEDDNYIVINKPPYVSTLDDRNNDVNILAMAKSYFAEAQVCHRIDKDTSGALAIAKNPDAYRSLSIQFENRKVNKLYHAVVDGIHKFEEELVDMPILSLSNGTVKIDYKKGKDASTYVNTLVAYKMHTLVACKPITGRMHQIRVHLSNQGAPIVGDNQYGGKPFFLSSVKKKYNLKKWTEELPLIKRFALHAYSIGFELPDGKNVEIHAPYPKDFNVLTKQLGKHIQ